MWTLPVAQILGVLCFTHIPLPGAEKAQQDPFIATRLKAALATGQQQRTSGLYLKALGSYELAGRLARQLGDVRQEAIASNRAGGCQLRLFQYRDAQTSLAWARELAMRAKDPATEGSADINLSTLYEQLGDFQRSEAITSEAAALLENTPRSDLYVRALLIHASTQLAQNEVKEGQSTFLKAIAFARRNKLAHEEGMAQNYLGIALLDTHDLAGAETALNEAYRLHTAEKDTDGVTTTQTSLADLRYRQGKYQESLKLLDDVLASQNTQLKEVPKYEPISLRGHILLALGRKDEALAELRTAVDLAAAWRRGALPGDATSTRTVALLNEIYQDYTELAAQLSLERHDSRLARQALEALAENRAASLREQIAIALDREGKLPPRYFELLSDLQAAQQNATLIQKPEFTARVQTIRLELSDLDNRLGIQAENSSKEIERNSLKRSLNVIQSRLSAAELLLSFCLGKERSYLWTVTRDQVNLYQLAGAAEISTRAAAFSEAARLDRSLDRPGQILSRELFGHLSPKDWEKPVWIVVGDGALLNGLPIAALPQLTPEKNETISASHSIRCLPSELLLLEGHRASSAKTFLGVGDPIYNHADARRKGPAVNYSRKQVEASVTLARLTASEREVRSSARMSGLPDVKILVGMDASTEKLKEALQNRPTVIHFAVHVVSPDGHPEQAALALSVAGDLPELLTPEVVASFRVPGSLVVLSGCASVQGQTLPSAGVIGLSRAWLLAGASAVLVSAWPTPDDSGKFFSSFYSHLQCQKVKAVSLPKQAATALQMAQIDMQRGGSAKSSPSLWAAYSIISKE